ncbi:MAG: M42 family peptidase [Clostridia bacterium]
MYNSLCKLCSLRGVSGWEDEVRAAIYEQCAPYAGKLFEDSTGNLYVFKSGAATRRAPLMVCAHMDEVGIIITSITSDGYLRFATVGGVDRRVIIGKRVRVGACALPGLIGVKAVHLSTKEERKIVPKQEDLYIDIGATTKAQAEKLVSPGDVATFDSEYAEFGDGYIKARALDDRIGCAAMLTLIREPLPFDTWFVFTVQEEIGLRGAAVAAARLAPASSLILETTTAADIPGMTGASCVCRADGGAVIGFMDRSTIYDKDYFALLCRLADENHIPWQIKTQIAGGNDAGIIHKSGVGVKTASISVPVRYIHSPACVAARDAIDAAVMLARLFIHCKEDENLC